MERIGTCAALSASMLLWCACSDGRWVHPTKTDRQARQDWELYKAEVLSGQEHRKETMAGGINLSGCMQSKGYNYTEAPLHPIPIPPGPFRTDSAGRYCPDGGLALHCASQ